jgi:hypothetical protein
MRKLDLPERRALPSRWAVMVLLACIVASLFITLGARAQNNPPKPTTPKTETTKPEPARPAASKPEESATIEDDETLVPDPKESADNNLTFPVDI